MTWGPWRHEEACCEEPSLELIDATQDPGAGANEALTVPGGGVGELVLGPWDTIAPAAIAGATEIGERIVFSGWFAAALLGSPGTVVSCLLEEFGSSGPASGYNQAELITVLSTRFIEPIQFTHTLRGRGARLVLRASDNANAHRVYAHLVARRAGAIVGEQANAADRHHAVYESSFKQAVGAAVTVHSPVVMVNSRHAVARMHHPPVAMPTEGFVVAPTCDIGWFISLSNSSSGAVIELEGSEQPDMSSPESFLAISVAGGGSWGSGVAVATLLGGGAAVQLADIESPYPFWRLKFTNGTTPQAAFSWAIRGG